MNFSFLILTATFVPILHAELPKESVVGGFFSVRHPDHWSFQDRGQTGALFADYRLTGGRKEELGILLARANLLREASNRDEVLQAVKDKVPHSLERLLLAGNHSVRPMKTGSGWTHTWKLDDGPTGGPVATMRIYVVPLGEHGAALLLCLLERRFYRWQREIEAIANSVSGRMNQALARDWASRLRGRRLTSKDRTYILGADGKCEYQWKSTIAGMEGDAKQHVAAGTWKMVERDGELYLALQLEGQSMMLRCAVQGSSVTIDGDLVTFN